MEKNIEFIESGLRCDNPECDWIKMEMSPFLSQHITKLKSIRLKILTSGR